MFRHDILSFGEQAATLILAAGLLIIVTNETFAGSLIAPASDHGAGKPQSFGLGCFIAAGGTAAGYNLLCNGHISEANAAARYLDLEPARQVAADVAAEEMTRQAPKSRVTTATPLSR
jgi:hypothetical protein